MATEETGESMNRKAYRTAAEAIQTLQQIHAILDAYHAIEADEMTKARILWAAESLAEFEIERQSQAQIEALRAEGFFDRPAGATKAA